jgi:cytochrome c-type biogenesis protein CcmH/NrfF
VDAGAAWPTQVRELQMIQPFVLLPVVLAAAQLSLPQQARVEALQGSLLAPCCYAEPVSRHQSELALRMKVEIARSVAGGKSDQEIIAAYKQQFGERIYLPPKPVQSWIQLVPWLALVAGAGVLILWLRKMAAGYRTSQIQGS